MKIYTTKCKALFVQPNGIYPQILGEEACWGEDRDARLYPGPDPVVAHPPCHLWVNLAALNFKRYGGEHNRPGNDGGCFASALASVRRWGGVLEHPAFSKAWEAHGLERPKTAGWTETDLGWVCEVWQSAYGHVARKRTWLYRIGPGRPPELRWERVSGVKQVGWFDRKKPTVSKKEASATPLAFALALIEVATEGRPLTLDDGGGVQS